MNDLIKNKITALPFSSFNFKTSTPISNQFYFQKTQCFNSCHYGTITDRTHLPPFVLEIPSISLLENITLRTQCSDGSNIETISPVAPFVNSFIVESDKPTIQSSPDGSGFYINTETNKLEDWNGTVFTTIVEEIPIGGLYFVSSVGFVMMYNGVEWVKTINGLQIFETSDSVLLINNGFEVSEMANCGFRQVILETDDYKLISELIDVKEDVLIYHKITVEDNCPINGIPYGKIIFSQYYYFHEDDETIIGEPEITIEEELEEDGVGNEIITFQKRKKEQMINTLGVPEYIIDFLFFVQMHNSISILYPKETISQKIDNYSISNAWLEGGCFGTCEIKFSTEEEIIKTRCCDIIDEKKCLESSIDVLRRIGSHESNQLLIESQPPSIGDKYLLFFDGIGGTNEWSFNNHSIATWNSTGWDYILPTDDLIITTLDDGLKRIYINSTVEWRLFNEITCSVSGFDVTINGYIPSTAEAIICARETGNFNFQKIALVNSIDLINGVVVQFSAGQQQFSMIVFDGLCDYGSSEVIDCDV